ncbi:phage integrase N-terminal SAM-like domain-containing protein [Limnoglobus roseus]|uniref:Integron integrase n=1 Tax=Limnoglobus roseus TaxID=2598579 RepID=A0A5C1APJ1_9BACT|nr:phage integrase N-terminal SAM-like domain-containing protein [Limnoglobus roseus]QEL20920.1 integron integrase [Limnoglobus roseus]
MSHPPPKPLDQLRHALRVRHDAIRTEDADHDGCLQFILFRGKQHPLDLVEPDVNAFLTDLAVDRHVTASTQSQALCALLLRYEHVLARPLDQLRVVRATRPKRLPVVRTRGEVRHVLGRLDGTPRLVALIPYGATG